MSVSHRGALRKLTGVQAALWRAGQLRPGVTANPGQDAALKSLAKLGIAEYEDSADDTALFRVLANCVICPIRVRSNVAFLNGPERRLWRWIRWAGLRLTMAELTLLTERGVKAVPTLLGAENRQALTEAIYTTETISDNTLEALMTQSPVRDDTARAVLGLLRKKKIYLI